MTYETMARIAQQGGAVYFLLIFVAACVYAYWPKRREEFDRVARLPLDEEG